MDGVAGSDLSRITLAHPRRCTLPLSPNLIVLRHSPDWLTFDLEESWPFLRSAGIDEDLVIDFAALWDRSFRISYREVRAGTKKICLDTISQVTNASSIAQEQWDGRVEAGGRVAFVDDDDWFADDLFLRLPPLQVHEEGVRWGSIRLGRLFREHQGETPILQLRPLDRLVYTNNYAVTQWALDRRGPDKLIEHNDAQQVFDSPGFKLIPSSEYLSCAVKHPCSTLSARFLMKDENFRKNPRRELDSLLAAIDAIKIEDAHAWLKGPFGQFLKLFSEA